MVNKMMESLVERFERRVFLWQESVTIATAVKRITDGRYIIPTDGFDWGYGQQIGIIESILKGIPLPYFLFTEKENGKLLLKDGIQRINAIFHFMNNDIRLVGPEDLFFRDLPKALKERFEDFNLQFVIIPFGTNLKDIDEILDKTVFSLRKIRNEGYEEGYDLGYKEGLRVGEYWA